jgi:glutamine amidotransferase
MIAIVDYGMGNPGSIHNMLSKIGADSIITSDSKTIREADKLILPGVGAFDTAMTNLNRMGVISVLNEMVLQKEKPILGICLGMQLMSKCSEEGTLPGLGWLDAETILFRFNSNSCPLKIPHMGWNTVNVQQGSALFKDMYEDTRFYFVHSYHVRCGNPANVLATTRYGFEFHSAVLQGNIVGTQFHPEKSHKYGMKVLRNFADMSP